MFVICSYEKHATKICGQVLLQLRLMAQLHQGLGALLSYSLVRSHLALTPPLFCLGTLVNSASLLSSTFSVLINSKLVHIYLKVYSAVMSWKYMVEVLPWSCYMHTLDRL